MTPPANLASEPDENAVGRYFCVLPWMHLCGSVDGVWGRCCVDSTMYQDDQYTDDNASLTLPTDAVGCASGSPFAPTNRDRVFGLEEAFNGPSMRRTRLAMLAGDPVRACTYCYSREAGGGESYRQKANTAYADDIEQLTSQTQPDGTVALFPTYLDIRFGNTCNLACVMCGYPVSSRWGIDKHPAWAPAHIDPYRNDNALWETLEAHATDLRKIYFAGGEPFLQQGHFRLLSILIESGAAAQVEIAYTSNLTVLPNHLWQLLEHFPRVSIGASCDGVGELFERIRVGASWDGFVANLRRAKTKVGVWLSVTPQRDNINRLGEIIDFAITEGIGVDLTNLLSWPSDLSVQSMDSQQKALAASYLNGLVDRYHSAGYPDIARQVEMARIFMNTRPEVPASTAATLKDS